MPNFLFHNERNGTFAEIAALAGVAVAADDKARSGMGTAFADFAGTERPGLIVTNHETEMHSLFQNMGGNLFSDLTPLVNRDKAAAQLDDFYPVYINGMKYQNKLLALPDFTGTTGDPWSRGMAFWPG